MTRMNLSFAIFMLANVVICIDTVFAKVFISRDQIQTNQAIDEGKEGFHQHTTDQHEVRGDLRREENERTSYALNRRQRRNIDVNNRTMDTSVSSDAMDSSLSSDAITSETDRQQLIEVIMQRILDKLNMTQIPDMSTIVSTVAERRKVIRLYRTSLEELQQNTQSSSALVDDESTLANQFHSFTDNGDRPTLVDGPVWAQTVTNTKRIFFNVSIPEPSDPRQETVVRAAKLKVYKRNVHPNNLIPSNTIGRSVRIDIYQTIRNPGPISVVSESRWLRKSIDSNLVSLETETGWEEFDIAMAVQEWIRDPETNFGLEIVCDSRYVMDELISFVTWGGSESTENNRVDLLPVLNVLTQSRSILRSHRSERSVQSSNQHEDCSSAHDSLCCRDHITVSFSEINWSSWVIEPASFNFYFCRNGLCPPGYKVANQYSRLKSDHLIRHPDTSPFSVLCTGTALSSLSIAHFTESGSTSVRVITDMFAAQCMCS